jgi:hypothetical protein
LNPQILHAEGSRQLAQTFSLFISFGSLMMIAFIVLVMGLFNDQAILLNVAEAGLSNSGV